VGTRGVLYVDFWNTKEIKSKTYDNNFQTSIAKNNTAKMAQVGWEREHLIFSAVSVLVKGSLNYVGVIQMIEQEKLI
jgi:hypothetical protein